MHSRGLGKLANAGAMRSVNHWARCLVLGVCHKCLRVLGVPHFAAALLNPGFGKIPDITSYIPYAQQWFMDGLNEVDFRTTDRCVKNNQNRYVPVWFPNGSTIKAEVIKMIAARIEIIQGAPSALAVEHAQAPDLNDSFEDDLGPNFSDMGDLPNVAAPENHLGTAIEQATRAVDKYLHHSKGYVLQNHYFGISLDNFELENSAANREQNKQLKLRYDDDPRVFWNRTSTMAAFPDFFFKFSIFIFSVKSSSASCERTFSRMGWMVSGRRSSITSENVDKRLTLANQLPQRKRLLTMCDDRKIK